MLRFLIAQAIAFGGFGFYKWIARQGVKQETVSQPFQVPSLTQIGPPTQSIRSLTVRQKFERIPLTPKQRFEILKRDGFTCQYCGRKPPEVVLEVDHIIAVYNGGTNDPQNLISSCLDCNRGKGADPL